MAFDPRYLAVKSTTEFDRRGTNECLGGFRPQRELVAATVAPVTVVAVLFHVDGEGSPVFGVGFVKRTVSVPLLPATVNTFEAEQGEYVDHGDFLTQLSEVDARHG